MDKIINRTYDNPPDEVYYIRQVAEMVYRYAFGKVFTGEPPTFPVKEEYVSICVILFYNSYEVIR